MIPPAAPIPRWSGPPPPSVDEDLPTLSRESFPPLSDSDEVDTLSEGLEDDPFDQELLTPPSGLEPIVRRGHVLLRETARRFAKEIAEPIYHRIESALETMASVRSVRPVFFVGAAATWQLAAALAVAAFFAGVAYAGPGHAVRKTFPKQAKLSAPAAAATVAEEPGAAPIEAAPIEAGPGESQETSGTDAAPEPAALGAPIASDEAIGFQRREARQARRRARARRRSRARRSR